MTSCLFYWNHGPVSRVVAEKNPSCLFHWTHGPVSKASAVQITSCIFHWTHGPIFKASAAQITSCLFYWTHGPVFRVVAEKNPSCLYLLDPWTRVQSVCCSNNLMSFLLDPWTRVLSGCRIKPFILCLFRWTHGPASKVSFVWMRPMQCNWTNAPNNISLGGLIREKICQIFTGVWSLFTLLRSPAGSAIKLGERTAL
jgi:hypothetical protein